MIGITQEKEKATLSYAPIHGSGMCEWIHGWDVTLYNVAAALPGPNDFNGPNYQVKPRTVALCTDLGGDCRKRRMRVYEGAPTSGREVGIRMAWSSFNFVAVE